MNEDERTRGGPIERPLLMDIPTYLATDRLILRPPRAEDAAVVLQNVRASLPELRPWMPWATDAYDLRSAEEWARRSAGQFLLRRELHFCLFLKDDRTHVGTCGIFDFDWRVPRCDFGYWLATPHWGNGYMSEAVTALTHLAFNILEMNRVEIGIDIRNARSRCVAERCGYALEGVLRNIKRDTSGGTVRRLHLCQINQPFAPVTPAVDTVQT